MTCWFGNLKPGFSESRLLGMPQTTKGSYLFGKPSSQGLSELRGQLQSYREPQQIPFLHGSSVRFCSHGGRGVVEGRERKKAGKENRQYKVGPKTESKLKPTYLLAEFNHLSLCLLKY